MEALKKILNCLTNKIEPEEPERDSMSSGALYAEPKIHLLDVPIKTRGKYRTPSGKPRGLVVHYTSGRSLNGAIDAYNSLSWMGSQGFGCYVMDKDGKIYRSVNQDPGQVAYHAGRSEWQGQKSLSYHLMGMEICCAGLLDTDLKTWFGVNIPEELTRRVDDFNNVRAGIYHRFTEAQEESLTNFILHQKRVNPEFDFDWVLGHDEIAVPRGRKTDPGGSLSMSMPEYRQLLIDTFDQQTAMNRA